MLMSLNDLKWRSLRPRGSTGRRVFSLSHSDSRLTQERPTPPVHLPTFAQVPLPRTPNHPHPVLPRLRPVLSFHLTTLSDGCTDGPSYSVLESSCDAK